MHGRERKRQSLKGDGERDTPTELVQRILVEKVDPTNWMACNGYRAYGGMR